MTSSLTAAATWGFETFGTAVGLALIAGAVAVALPWLNSLVAALVALALAAWSSRATSGTVPPIALTPSAVGIAGALGTAGIVFLAAPAPLGAWRGLVLALGVVPLWYKVRERRRGPPRRSP
jgi:hypothetical protein